MDSQFARPNMVLRLMTLEEETLRAAPNSSTSFVAVLTHNA